MSSSNSFFESMVKRDQERKLVIEKKQLAKELKPDVEGIDFFESSFNKKVVEIDNKLDSLHPSTENSNLHEDFKSIVTELQELQQYFTSSTLFLTDRKIQQCQNVINRLVTKSDEIKSKIMPKKKFGFKNKSTFHQPTSDETAKIPVKHEQNKILLTEVSRKNQCLVINSEKSNMQDLTFKDLDNCLIIIKGYPGSVQLSHLRACLLVCGPVSGSIFADACENCTFAISCQQLRLHSSVACNIYMHVCTRAIIEDSRDIHVAPSSFSYEGYEDDFKKAGLSNTNNWENVGDFNWLSADKVSPNWSRIRSEERIVEWEGYIEEFKGKHGIP